MFSKTDILNLSVAWEGTNTATANKESAGRAMGSVHRSSKNSEPTPAKLSTPVNALVSLNEPVDMSVVDRLRKNMERKGYRFLYVHGAKKAVKFLQAQMGDWVIPVTNAGNIEALRASPGVEVIELGRRRR